MGRVGCWVRLSRHLCDGLVVNRGNRASSKPYCAV
jgi:hypothetical protein